MYSPVALMDVDEEIKMLEEYRDALSARLEKVSKRLAGLKRWNGASLLSFSKRIGPLIVKAQLLSRQHNRRRSKTFI